MENSSTLRKKEMENSSTSGGGGNRFRRIPRQLSANLNFDPWLDENVKLWPNLNKLVQCYRTDWVKDENEYGYYESISPVSFQDQIFEGPDTDIEELDENLEQWPNLNVQCYRTDWVTDENEYGYYESISPVSFQDQIFERPDTDIETETHLASSRQIIGENTTDDDIPDDLSLVSHLFHAVAIMFARILSQIVRVRDICLLSSFISHFYEDTAAAASTASCHMIRDSLSLTTFGSITERVPESRDRCAVCLDQLRTQDKVKMLNNCCHVFHGHCIDRWIDCDHLKTCPLCRTPLFASSSQSQSLSLVRAEPSWAVEYFFGDSWAVESLHYDLCCLLPLCQ